MKRDFQCPALVSLVQIRALQPHVRPPDEEALPHTCGNSVVGPLDDSAIRPKPGPELTTAWRD